MMEINNKVFHDVEDASIILGVSKSTIYKWIKAGKIKAIKIRRCRGVLIDEDEIRKVLLGE